MAPPVGGRARTRPYSRDVASCNINDSGGSGLGGTRGVRRPDVLRNQPPPLPGGRSEGTVNSPSEPPRARAMVLSLWLVMFTVASQFLIVAPILPRIGEQLSVPDAYLGTLVTGYAIAVASFAILAGPISDRYGRRLVLRVGTAWMAVALLLHGLADSYITLLGLRVLAGAASGILSGAAIAYIGDVLPYERRGATIGWVMSGMAFGQILGIPAGTVLADLAGFQAPFTAFGALMILAWVGTMLVLVPPRVSTTDRLTLASALFGYAQILRRRELLVVSIASTTMMLSVSSFIVYQPAWLESSFGVGSTEIASLFLVGGIANALMGPVAGRLSDRFGRKGLVVGSSLGLAVLMALTPYIPAFGWAYALFFIIMVMVGARISPLNAWMTALVDSRRRGKLMSLTMATGQAGFALGAAAAGWTYVSLGYAANAWIAAAGAALTAILLARFVPEPGSEAG